MVRASAKFYDTAMATSAPASAAATLACSQAIATATTAFENSRAAAVAAGDALDAAVDVANTKKDAIWATSPLNPVEVRADPSLITAQSDAVKAAGATYATASAAAVAAQAPYAAALAALGKLALSVEPTDPGSAFQSGDVASIAEATRAILMAAATSAKERAENVFNGVRFSLWTKLNDQN